ncbi:hypothetical protein TrLO_g4301 [Triparma laevis f. longispina]|uniref:Uncharacterized protein n=1 Tax=Triparma laevis f. longispina TaxID=1714387 RepID=A0A9W7E5V0_9STRA|nr:hypothetical protein TrLO_g4301 [Triparma laevis f. longispina]
MIFYHEQTQVQEATTMCLSSPALLGLTGCDPDFLAAGKKLKEGTAKQVLFDLESICEWDGTSCVSDMKTEDRVGDYNDYVPGTNSLMIGGSYGFDKYGHGDFIKIMGILEKVTSITILCIRLYLRV